MYIVDGVFIFLGVMLLFGLVIASTIVRRINFVVLVNAKNIFVFSRV